MDLPLQTELLSAEAVHHIKPYIERVEVCVRFAGVQVEEYCECVPGLRRLFCYCDVVQKDKLGLCVGFDGM